jgi:hypothetical protein
MNDTYVVRSISNFNSSIKRHQLEFKRCYFLTFLYVVTASSIALDISPPKGIDEHVFDDGLDDPLSAHLAACS